MIFIAADVRFYFMLFYRAWVFVFINFPKLRIEASCKAVKGLDWSASLVTTYLCELLKLENSLDKKDSYGDCFGWWDSELLLLYLSYEGIA